MSAVVNSENKHLSSNGTSLFNEYDGLHLTIRILFNGREVGNVIGKKGITIKNIRNQSGARILISNCSTLQRVVLISGNRIEICKATELIALKVEEYFERSKSNWIGSKTLLTFKLIVPASQCCFIIGKNGSKIREIIDSSRAAIQVRSDMLPNSTERLVSITGTTDTISHCVYLVCNVLLDFGAERNIPLTNLADLGLGTATNRGFNPGAGSQLRAGNRFNHNVNGEQYDKNVNSNIDTITIYIPNGLIGCVIGKRGSKIAEIRRISGAIVHIFQSQGTIENGEKVDRRIMITGNKESVSVAKYLIEMSVELQKANRGEVILSSSPDDGSIPTLSTSFVPQLDPLTVISSLFAYGALFGHKKSPPIQTTGVHRPKNNLKRRRSSSNGKTKVEKTKFARY